MSEVRPGARTLDSMEISNLLELEEKVCSYCLNKFKPKRSNQKYCSGYCRRNSRHRISVSFQRELAERTCEWCGKEIGEGKRKHAKYCSVECKREANDSKPCIYCGVPANSKDHFIPKAFVRRLEDIAKVKKENIIVPCCLECNSTAGAHIFKTLKEKRSFIKDCYKRKYKKILEAPDWTEQEIIELGHSLKNHVVASQNAKVILQARLKWRGN